MASFRCRLILLLAVLVWCCVAKAAQIDRDIILVPNEVQQVPGKAMLYEPKPNAFEQFRNRVWNNSVDGTISDENDEPLWLGPLKHALFLMFSSAKVNGTESDAIAAKAIQQAEFIGLRISSEANTKFGDVINLANGKIEFDRDSNVRIVEQAQNCINRCFSEITDGYNATAFWSIYRIRHRDDKRQFRYEWKFMIRKLKISRRDNGRNVDHDHCIVRSFILRDDDYPKYFSSETIVGGHRNEPRMEKRIFTTGYDRINVPFKLNEQNNAKLISNRNAYYHQHENLNTGEYYAANGGYISKQSDPVGYYRRPAESPQWVAQEIQQQPQQQQHHYFLNNDHDSAREEGLLFKGPHYEQVTAYPVAASYPSPIQHLTQIQNPMFPNGAYRDSYPPIQSNSPLHFPKEYSRIRFDPIGRTKFRGPYDDNRESILDEEPQHAYHNQHVNVNGHSNHLRFPSDNVRDIGALNTARPYQSSSFNFDNTSPASVAFPDNNNNNQNFNEISNAAFKTGYDRQLLKQLYRYESSNLRNVNGARANFAASIPFKESSYSEPDPYYHGQYSVTPYSLVPESADQSTLVSQLPHDYGSDGSVLASTESHHLQNVATIESDELSQTTPFTFDDTSTTLQNQYHSSEYFDPNNNHNQRYGSISSQLPAPETDSIASSYASATEHGLVNLNRNEEIQTETNAFALTDFNSEPTTMESQVTTRRADETTFKTSIEKTLWKPKRSRSKQTEIVKEQKVERNPVTVKKKHSSGNRKRKVYHEKLLSTQKPEKGGESMNTSSTSTTTTTIKSTTAASKHDDEEPRTSQSVHKTVSVHIGEKITVFPNSEEETNHKVRGSTKYKSKMSKVKKV